MLETIREFGLEALAAAGEEGPARRRHFQFFFDRAQAAAPHLGIDPARDEWLDRLRAEHANLRAALDWCIEAGEAETGMRLVAALRYFWYWHNYWREGQDYLDRLLALPGAAARTTVRAAALQAAGMMAQNQGQATAARAFLEESVEIYRELGDRGGAVGANGGLAWLAHGRGDFQMARALFEELISFFREVGDKGSLAGYTGNLSLLASGLGNHEEAWRLHREQVALLRELGFGPKAAVWDAVLLHIRQGELATARSILEERLASDPEGCRRDSEGRPFYYLAVVLLRQGDAAAARAILEAEFLPFVLKAGRGQARCLETFAAVAVAEGAAGRAAHLFGAAEALREAGSFAQMPADQGPYEASVAAVRSLLGEAEFAAAWAEGRAMSLDQAIAEALSATAVATSVGE
jgi:tetratricopeptide (TPR) repeat protein